MRKVKKLLGFCPHCSVSQELLDFRPVFLFDAAKLQGALHMPLFGWLARCEKLLVQLLLFACKLWHLPHPPSTYVWLRLCNLPAADRGVLWRRARGLLLLASSTVSADRTCTRYVS